MKSMRIGSVVLAATVLATALTGCGWLERMPEKLELSAIGEGSGSGELVSHGNGTFASSEFDAIEVKGEALAIFITRSTSDQAEVELLMDQSIGNRITFDSAVESRTLRLSVKEDTRSIGKNQRGERKLLIALPEKMYGKLSVTNAFGRIDIRDITAEQIQAKIDAGQIIMAHVEGALDVRTEAGEVALSGITLEHDLIAKSSVGTITIDLDKQPSAAEVVLSSDLGSVESDLAELNAKEQSGKRLAGSISSGGPKLEAHSDVGTVAVRVKQ